MKITVHGPGVPGSFKRDSGEEFHWKTQQAYLHVEGRPYPTPFKLNLRPEDPDYSEGVDYVFDGDSFTTDEKGRLLFARNMVLRPVRSASAPKVVNT